MTSLEHSFYQELIQNPSGIPCDAKNNWTALLVSLDGYMTEGKLYIEEQDLPRIKDFHEYYKQKYNDRLGGLLEKCNKDAIDKHDTAAGTANTLMVEFKTLSEVGEKRETAQKVQNLFASILSIFTNEANGPSATNKVCDSLEIQ